MDLLIESQLRVSTCLRLMRFWDQEEVKRQRRIRTLGLIAVEQGLGIDGALVLRDELKRLSADIDRVRRKHSVPPLTHPLRSKIPRYARYFYVLIHPQA